MTPRKRKQIDPLEEAIGLVLSPGNFISYAAASSFVDAVQDVASGNFGMLVEDLFLGWIKSPQAATHDPDETAKLLLSGFEDIVSGAPKHVEPPFLEQAKARWLKKRK